MRLKALTALAMVSILGSGCSTTQTLTLVSTRNVDLSATHDAAARGEKASDGLFWLLFIPFGAEPNGIATTTELLKKHDGDFLTNVEVKSTGWSLLAISWGSVEVKGDVYRRIDQAPGAPPATTPEPATEAAPEQ